MYLNYSRNDPEWLFVDMKLFFDSFYGNLSKHLRVHLVCIAEHFVEPGTSHHALEVEHTEMSGIAWIKAWLFIRAALTPSLMKRIMVKKNSTVTQISMILCGSLSLINRHNCHQEQMLTKFLE